MEWKGSTQIHPRYLLGFCVVYITTYLIQKLLSFSTSSSSFLMLALALVFPMSFQASRVSSLLFSHQSLDCRRRVVLSNRYNQIFDTCLWAGSEITMCRSEKLWFHSGFLKWEEGECEWEKEEVCAALEESAFAWSNYLQWLSVSNRKRLKRHDTRHDDIVSSALFAPFWHFIRDFFP